MLDKRALTNFKNMDDKYAVMVLVSGKDIEDNTSDILKELMKKRDQCLYVTINQPYVNAIKILNKKGIDTDKVFFIDCITKTSGGEIADSDNSVYLDSPSNLTELSISISQALEGMEGKKILFFDALSTLMIYNKPTSFAKFVHSVMTKAKSMSITSIFIIVENEIKKDMLSEIEQFADNSIDLR